MLASIMADVQTGFGPFVAVYLTAHKWTQVDIGLALSLGSVTAMVGQLPAGAIIDMMCNKWAAAAAGIVAVVAAALILAVMPYRFPVLVAEVLHGLASYVITPAIAAISLRLVGHAALAERLGRNASFASIGNGLAAGVMGAIGMYLRPAPRYSGSPPRSGCRHCWRCGASRPQGQRTSCRRNSSSPRLHAGEWTGAGSASCSPTGGCSSSRGARCCSICPTPRCCRWPRPR